MAMAIEEAISHARETSKRDTVCEECRQEHAQLADWLEELKMLRTAITPPNEPLTLEQLRKMDGEPVWIVDIGPNKWYGPGWAIVDRDNCLVRTAKNWNPVFFERYGERWLAYRRPKEEQ